MEKLKKLLILDKRLKITSSIFLLSGILLCGIGLAIVDFKIVELDPSPEAALVEK